MVRQSALFLSSDAAKQFLTRQLSWVTGSSELDDEPAENSPREPAYTFTLGPFTPNYLWLFLQGRSQGRL